MNISLIFSLIVLAWIPVPSRSGREPSGEPIFEEDAGRGDTSTSVPSLTRGSSRFQPLRPKRKGRKLQNWVVDTWTRQKPEKLVNGKNTAHVRTRPGLSQNGHGRSTMLMEAQEFVWMTCTTSEKSLFNESVFSLGRMAISSSSGFSFRDLSSRVGRSTNRALT